jgi:hypothetical protein
LSSHTAEDIPPRRPERTADRRGENEEFAEERFWFTSKVDALQPISLALETLGAIIMGKVSDAA